MLNFILKSIKIVVILSLMTCFIGISGYSFHQAFISRNYNVQIFTHHVVKQKTFIKNNKTVILLGMIHLGEESFYNKIREDFSGGKFLALTEGVSDQGNLVSSSMEYTGIAQLVGLKMQPKDLFSREKKADLDVKDLDPNFIKKMEKFFALVNKIQEATAQDLENLPEISEEEFVREAQDKRNEKLKKVFLKTVENEDFIVIPWGSAHMIDMENFLLAQGYRQKEVKFRPAINVPYTLGYFVINNTSLLYLLKHL